MDFLMHHYFNKGDHVTIAGITGRIEEIRPDHVKLIDEEGNICYIPNYKISCIKKVPGA